MLELVINKTWNGLDTSHTQNPVIFRLSSFDETAVEVEIDAPFFNSPSKPPNRVGEFFNLWDYEVAELFFLAESGKYLEVEFGPYGHYVVLLLDKGKKTIKTGLKLDYSCEIVGSRWHGKARIPASYFPQRVIKLNAYAIHGVDQIDREYESLYPVPQHLFSYPDFHRVDYFGDIDFNSLLASNENDEDGIEWNFNQTTNSSIND